MLWTTLSNRPKFLLISLIGEVEVGALLDKRREYSKARLAELSKRLDEAANAIEGRACIYMTGSFARGEASAQSDVDLFIVGLTDVKTQARQLSKLNEI